MLVAETNADTFVLGTSTFRPNEILRKKRKFYKTSNDCVFIVRRIKFHDDGEE